MIFPIIESQFKFYFIIRLFAGLSPSVISVEYLALVFGIIPNEIGSFVLIKYQLSIMFCSFFPMPFPSYSGLINNAHMLYSVRSTMAKPTTLSSISHSHPFPLVVKNSSYSFTVIKAGLTNTFLYRHSNFVPVVQYLQFRASLKIISLINY